MTDRGLEILRHLFDYLDGLTSLRDFQSWSAGLAADSHQWGDPEAEELATQLIVLFSEAAIEGWTESEIRDECAELALAFVSPGSVAVVPLADNTLAHAGPSPASRTGLGTSTETRTVTLRAA